MLLRVVDWVAMDLTFEYKSMSQSSKKNHQWMLVALIAVSSASIGSLLTVAVLAGKGQTGPTSLASETTWCESRDFKLKTTKTVLDVTMAAVLPEISEVKFENSGVAINGTGMYFVGDSSWEIPVLHDLSETSELNAVFKTHKEYTDDNYFAVPANETAFPKSAESGWEAITYDASKDEFIAVQEAVGLKDGLTHAMLMSVYVSDTTKSWYLRQACPSEFAFPAANKGFEGAAWMPGVDGRTFVLGLCEGNYCEGEDRGKDPGNGRIVIMELHTGVGPPNHFDNGEFVQTSTCVWKTVTTINIPAVAHFEDYSDIDIHGDSVVISSQASASLWVGRITLENGKVNPKTVALKGDLVVNFMPTSTCQVQYCNVEAISFLSERLLIAGSDAMKSKGKQQFQCLDKDQSVHVFTLPTKVHY